MKKFQFRVNGNLYEVELLKVEDTVSGITNYAPPAATEKSVESVPQPAAQQIEAVPVAKPAAAPSGFAKKGGIRSPLPGIIRSIDVKVGDKIKKHDKVAVIEAMKMDNNIVSEIDGTVVSICKGNGDQVLEGDVLIEIGG